MEILFPETLNQSREGETSLLIRERTLNTSLINFTHQKIEYFFLSDIKIGKFILYRRKNVRIPLKKAEEFLKQTKEQINKIQ